jgi:hypothetical protein
MYALGIPKRVLPALWVDVCLLRRLATQYHLRERIPAYDMSSAIAQVIVYLLLRESVLVREVLRLENDDDERADVLGRHDVSLEWYRWLKPGNYEV